MVIKIRRRVSRTYTCTYLDTILIILFRRMQIIPICLSVSCSIALVIHAVTYFKMRRLGIDEEKSMFDMGRLAEVIMTIAVFMALAPGFYVR